MYQQRIRWHSSSTYPVKWLPEKDSADVDHHLNTLLTSLGPTPQHISVLIIISTDLHVILRSSYTGCISECLKGISETGSRDATGESVREFKQRQNNNKNMARPEKENEWQRRLLLVLAEGLCLLSSSALSGPCLSSFGGLSFHVPGEQVFIGSRAESMHTQSTDWEVIEAMIEARWSLQIFNSKSSKFIYLP